MVKKSDERSALTDLVQRQNAEIARMRMCLRKANSYLYSAIGLRDETDNSQRMAQYVESAIDWIVKTEPYEVQ